MIVVLARSRWLNRLVTPASEWALDRTTDLQCKETYLDEREDLLG